ncbi:hypothetical protein M1P56_35040 (plasmid) [Streptomyces sp. HU2014]|uniref:hypothetical protein n=1 Tax=Streptomyces sp. HU2014 TaxID=2939414 RepID=UPI00200F5582|nr:hypothetical protein [Streptomyces sp. HU2014]UQI49734.1 hypothetical protein M1P56_35040 [Streptomyces sp. HU2014]
MTTDQMLDLDQELQVLCDPASTSLNAFTEKFYAFRESLTDDERAYLDFIRRAADVAAADHGHVLLDDIDQFEAKIKMVLGEDYEAPMMGGPIIRTTVITRCATWLLKC